MKIVLLLMLCGNPEYVVIVDGNEGVVVRPEIALSNPEIDSKIREIIEDHGLGRVILKEGCGV